MLRCNCRSRASHHDSQTPFPSLPIRRLLRRAGVLCALLLALCPAQSAIRDGGIDPKNLGKGEWIYILPNAVNQMGGYVPAVTNLSSMMAFLKNQGLNYVIIKAATGATLFPSDGAPQFTAEVVNAGHAAGLWVFGYNRSYATNVAGEIAVVDFVFNQGADGFVWDAEMEWESSVIGSQGPTLAIQQCSAVRSNWPNKFLAHAPAAYRDWHSSFPYREFGYYCDAVMPQEYWIEFGKSATLTVTEVNTQWRNWQNTLSGIWTNAIKPLAPAGQGWTSGSGTITAAQITEFFTALKTVANPATAGGYKGANFWRAELHPQDVWDAVRTNSIGNAPTNAPVVANVRVERVSDSTATIVWTTDQQSDSAVDYGPTISYGSAVTNTTAFWYHTVNLAGLTPDLTYHYRAKSKNAANQLGLSGDYVFTTASASVSDVIVESRQPNGTLTPNPPYADAGFLNSTLKSSAPPLTGSTNQGSRYATGLSGTPTITIRPTLAAAGGTYDVYLTHGSASSISDNIVVSVSQSGCTGLPATTTIFQEPGGNTWEYLGRMTLNAGVSVPTLTFTYSSGTLDGSNRMYSDGIKFVYVPPPPSGPSIATQPQSRTNVQGSSATFTVVASGTPLLYYQWRFSGTNIADATDSTYTRNNVQPAHAGDYAVVITNIVSAITSSPAAVLTVIVPPAITAHPQSVITNAGANVAFTVTANGTAPLAYQWRFNAEEIAGATASAYNLTGVQSSNAGNYSVIVSNAAGTAISDDAVLTVESLAPPHLDAIVRLADGRIRLIISGDPGHYGVDGATNLSVIPIDWMELTNLITTTNPFEYTDPQTNLPQRFYRAKSLSP